MAKTEAQTFQPLNQDSSVELLHLSSLKEYPKSVKLSSQQLNFQVNEHAVTQLRVCCPLSFHGVLMPLRCKALGIRRSWVQFGSNATEQKSDNDDVDTDTDNYNEYNDDYDDGNSDNKKIKIIMIMMT